MSYHGPSQFELLVLITKYNLANPAAKLNLQENKSLNERKFDQVADIIAQEVAIRAKYPYNSVQKQAQKLLPLLGQVLRLDNFASYEKLEWMELLIAINDMMKMVRSTMAETDRIRGERYAKEQEKKKAWHAAEKAQKAKEEERRAEKQKKEKERQAAKAAEQAKAMQKDHRPNKLQKKPNALVYPGGLLKAKENKIEIPDKRYSTPESAKEPEAAETTPQVPANSSPEVSPRCPYPASTGPHFHLEGYVPMDIPGPMPLKLPKQERNIALPPLPPRKVCPPADRPKPKPTAPPPRSALLTRMRGKDEPKKKVSFDDDKKAEVAKDSKDEDTVMAGLETTPVPGAWGGDSVSVMSDAQPKMKVPDEKVPKRKKGTEPEHHQTKMDKAHDEALRVVSEIDKYSWPGMGEKK